MDDMSLIDTLANVLKIEDEVQGLLLQIGDAVRRIGTENYNDEVTYTVDEIMQHMRATSTNAVAMGVMAHLLTHLMYDAEKNREGFGMTTATAVLLLAKAGMDTAMQQASQEGEKQ